MILVSVRLLRWRHVRLLLLLLLEVGRSLMHRRWSVGMSRPIHLRNGSAPAVASSYATRLGFKECVQHFLASLFDRSNSQ
jgi:hypothetical protein